MFDDTIKGGAIDMPEDTDYSANHMLGVEDGFIPLKVKFKTIPDNQGNTVACTCYATYHVGRILNELEKNRPLQGMPSIGWQLQQKFGTSSKNGDLVQTALKSIVKNGLHCEDKIYGILAYARIEPQDLKTWLARGFPVVTSTLVTKTNFKKAKYEGIWGGNDGARVAGHAIALAGYEDSYIWGLNSYNGWGFWNDGYFKIKEDDIKFMGSMYILYDEKDSTNIFRDVTNLSPFAKEITWALEENLLKGYDSETLPAEKRFFKPNAPLTRAEFAAVLYRFKQLYL